MSAMLRSSLLSVSRAFPVQGRIQGSTFVYLLQPADKASDCLLNNAYAKQFACLSGAHFSLRHSVKGASGNADVHEGTDSMSERIHQLRLYAKSVANMLILSRYHAHAKLLCRS